MPTESSSSSSGSSSVSTLFGIALSAMIPLAAILIPIYLFFIKPALEKRRNKINTISSEAKATTTATAATKRNLLIDQSNTVPIEDLSYLANILTPDSTHMDVLLAVVTTPENIEWSIQDLHRAETVYQERLEKEKDSSSKKKSNSHKNKDIIASFEDVLTEDGWADDDEDEQNNDAVLKSKQADEERKAEMERLKQATGQAVQLLEGIDDGVLGQKWVEKSLTAAGVWPPKDMKLIQHKTFDYQGKSLSPLDHPGLRRILCMTVGRLNSLYLNGHPELLQAGAKKLIDQTYFKSSMEFRMRAGIVLEAALRVGMMVRSSRLVETVLETVCMFKIGTTIDTKSISWFNTLMMKQYNILPRISIKSIEIVTPDVDNDDDEKKKYVVTGDISEVHIDIDRVHAENFLRQKIDMFQKQGIPPQVGLSTYREGWWFLLRMKRIDGDETTTSTALEEEDDALFDKDNAIFQQIQFDKRSLATFEQESKAYRLITAWPMIVQNVAQKSGKIKIMFEAPSVPGTYRYTVIIKSQEFLDADQSRDIDVKVVDTKTANREPRKLPEKPTPPDSEATATTAEEE